MDKLLITFAIILLFIIPTVTSTFYVVKEGEQVIITEFGRAVDQKTQAGLHVKKPFIQNVVSFSKRILEWNGLPNQITTKDKRFIWVDTTARWQIVDALAFYRSQRNEDIAQSRLDDIIDSATRDLITGQLLIEVVRNSNRILSLDMSRLAEEDQDAPIPTEEIEVGREQVTQMVLEKANQKLSKEFGIQLIDVRIKRINYVDEVQQKVFSRMISERKQIAAKYQSEGEGEAANIQGQMQKDLEQIQSEGYKKAEQIKGQADAEAIEIYASAHNQDPEFYAFLQTLETYAATIGNNSKLYLSTDSDLYQYLKTTGTTSKR